MKRCNRIVCTATLACCLFTGQALAASWQDQLSSAANELSQSGTDGEKSSSLSLSSLSALLTGGSQALSASNLTNAAGVLQYCMKNKLVTDINSDNIKSKLLDKLGLNNTAAQTEKPDYTQGLLGLLKTGEGNQLDLNSLGSSPLAEKVKTKACDFVLKQGANFIS